MKDANILNSVILLAVLLLSLVVIPVFGFGKSAAGDGIISKIDKLKSKILKQKRTVYISLPSGYAESDKKYPVLYVLVANVSDYEHSVESVRSMTEKGIIPGMIVVGLGDIDGGKDLTPSKTRAYGANSGGAGEFLKFVKEEVFPHVDKNFRTLPCRMFKGHSIVGVVGIYAFLSEPDMFNAVILSSPFFVYDKGDKFLLNNTDSLLKKRSGQNTYLYITVGNEPNLMEPIEAFNAKVKGVDGVQLKYDVKMGESHRTIKNIVLTEGLKAAYSDWSKPCGK